MRHWERFFSWNCRALARMTSRLEGYADALGHEYGLCAA